MAPAPMATSSVSLIPVSTEAAFPLTDTLAQLTAVIAAMQASATSWRRPNGMA